MPTTATTLLNFILELLSDPEAAAAFAEDGDAALAAAGLSEATCGDGAGSRGATAVKIGSPMPTVAYTVPKGVPYVPSPVVFGDHIYLWGDSGIVTCIKAATGELVWSERVGGGGNFFGSPVCAGGKLYNVSERGELVVLDASPEFKLQGRSQLGEGSHSTPAIANGMMFIRTFTHVIALGGKKL